MPIVGIIVAAVIVLAIYIVTRPSTFRVERSATIGLPPGELFPYVNDFRRWTSWSPWEGIDPNLTRTYAGSPAGKGAVYEWSGNSKAGKGRMAILDSVPNEKILIDLGFEKPFKAQSTTEFHFKPSGSGTTVTWAVYGPNTTMGKVMCLFGGMEKFVGKDFDKGLANLAAVAQSDAEGRRARVKVSSE